MAETGKSPEQVARSWAAVTIQKFRRNIENQQIGSSFELKRSFKAFVQAESGGDKLKIKLVYAMHGKFVDMGVGRGRKLGSSGRDVTGRKTGSGRTRRAKKWYSKTIAAETFILGQIMQDKYSADAMAVFKELPGQINLQM